MRRRGSTALQLAYIPVMDGASRLCTVCCYYVVIKVRVTSHGAG